MTPTLARLYGSQSDMGSVPDVRSETVAGLITSDRMTSLARILDPGVEMVIWRRTLPPEMGTWLEVLPAHLLTDLRMLVAPRNLRRALLPILEADGIPDRVMRDWLVDDIDGLVGSFADILQCDLVDVRLERIERDACWKFHRDSVPARLITTYRGPGTQWVLPCHANRALVEQRAYVGLLERVPQHAVAIFKGSYAANGAGIVHRSPPIAGSGIARWVLCLNEPSGSSPDPWEP